MLQNLARGSIAALLAALAALPVHGAPLKVGFVYVSPIGEAGWTYQHDLGRRAMQQALGDQAEVTVVEAVAEGPDSERVMRDLAAQGHGLVFATSFGYLEPALRVAAQFPEVKFEHAGGYKTAPNLNTYNARYYEARYLAGLLAGKTSKGGIAGYVAGFPVPEVIQGINAFAIGMREANPQAQVKVLWLNSWFDPAREREAALTLIHQGADVLTNHSGSPAVAQTAQEQGVKLVAYQSDMRRFAPQAQLTAIVHQWGGYYTRAARAVIAGTWKPQPVWGGLKDGFITLAPYGADVPKDVVALVEAKRRAIVEGSFKPFGKLSDAQIAAMDSFVPGVSGAVPK
ncbi:BMP family ABC transporter substrate-binding protein [Piscinibacter sp. XHJ-5]|uniref:BMP family ABC transporter substrate-binding protein n=1 Tax=Piscinibacter sp. XHJ-5 TaxID=3037797 RepID=UPI00245311AD|nr:BMP family ABC transporter substrate-binding protein [Piscinibacter sp. XHJ-5]